MGKKITYTFTGTFEIETDGAGYGKPVNFTQFLHAFKKSNRWYITNANGNFSISETQTAPKKDWGLRFKNRLRKAHNILRANTSFEFPADSYQLKINTLPNTCGRLVHGGWGEMKFGFYGYCISNLCKSKNYHCNGSIWKHPLCSLQPDNNGTVVIEVTDEGNNFLKDLGRQVIPHTYVVGHLDDNDIVQKMVQSITDIVNAFGDAKFHA